MGQSSRTGDSGEGTEYTAGEMAELADALGRAFAAAGRAAVETASLVVTAVIEWSGTVDKTTKLGTEGMRSIRIDDIDLTKVRDAVERAREAGQAEYGRSYDAKGWHARFTQLTGTAQGRAAADAAELNPSRTTLRRWLAGTQRPNKRNRQAIDRAYEDTRSQVAGRQRSRASDRGQREVARVLTEKLHAEYGVNVRFRDIQNLEIR